MKVQIRCDGKEIGDLDLPEGSTYPLVGTPDRPLEMYVDGENRAYMVIVQRLKRANGWNHPWISDSPKN